MLFKQSTPCYWSLVSCYRRKRLTPTPRGAEGEPSRPLSPSGNGVDSSSHRVGLEKERYNGGEDVPAGVDEVSRATGKETHIQRLQMSDDRVGVGERVARENSRQGVRLEKRAQTLRFGS